MYVRSEWMSLLSLTRFYRHTKLLHCAMLEKNYDVINFHLLHWAYHDVIWTKMSFLAGRELKQPYWRNWVKYTYIPYNIFTVVLNLLHVSEK